MTTTRPNPMEQLRADAERQLQNGTTQVSEAYGLGTEALSSLYRLASDPERSGDALKLLHELQTHQVELDLQHAQLAENEQELAGQLGHFQALYDHAPAAYLVLGRDGRILRSNRAASKLFGLDAGQLEDHMLSSLLSQESKPALQAALENAGSGQRHRGRPGTDAGRPSSLPLFRHCPGRGCRPVAGVSGSCLPGKLIPKTMLLSNLRNG